jgi:Filamentous haemagglutinin family outer membrane protein
VILASTTHADERGGDVSIGVGWSAQWNAASHTGGIKSDGSPRPGGINLEVGSQIDVSGGSKGGLSDGTVTLRAPEDGNNDVKIQQIGSTISGARAVKIEGYVSFDTTGSANGIDGSIPPTGFPRNLTVGSTDVTWDGIVDPAGWFDSTGALLPGTFTGLTGWKMNFTAGSGYLKPPTITLQTAAGNTGTVLSSLTVLGYTLTSGGVFSKFPVLSSIGAPTLTSWPGGVVPATAGTLTASIIPSALAGTTTTGITITAVTFSGTLPTGAKVVFSDGSGGTSFAATPIISAGKWTGIKVTNGGSFTTAPNLSFVIKDASGNIISSTATGTAVYKVTSVAINNAGAGYAAPPTFSFLSGTSAPTTAPVGTANMGVLAAITDPGLAASQIPYNVVVTPASLEKGSGASGTIVSTVSDPTIHLTGTVNSSGVFTQDPADAGYYLLTTNGTGSNNGPASANGTGIFKPTTYNTAHQLFFTTLLESVAEGSWSYTHQDSNGNTVTDHYGLSGALTRLSNYTQSNGNGVTSTGSVHVQPGIQLVNSSSTVNGGDITVRSNWNLAAGKVYSADGTTPLSTGQNYSASDSLQFLYRYGIEPGTLTLRAVRNVNIDASISDGFFQFYNYNDPGYIASLIAYLGRSDTSGYKMNGYSSVPLVPYDPSANLESPTGAQLDIADVFPNTICIANCSTNTPTNIVAPGSWSYRVTAGADIGSANPNATASLASFGDHAAGANAGQGNVLLDQHQMYNASVLLSATASTKVPVNIPTMLRTGTGSIAVAAARDLVLADQLAPGVIYTAGVNTALLDDPKFQLAVVGGTNTLQAQNPSGFLEPKILLQTDPVTTNTAVFAEPNAAAFPQMGGDISIAVRQDVIGFQKVQNLSQSSTPSFTQLYSPWLLSIVEIGLQQNTSYYTQSLGAGVFTPITTTATNIAPSSTKMMQQSAWWIQFSAFDQGVMSVGGNVTLTAGRDVRDFSVSLPTTGRVSGGLSVQLPNGQFNTPATHLYGSGNLTMNVGRSLVSGSFYEGSGHASIEVRGSVSSDWQASTTSGLVSAATVTAVDTGQLALTAGGAISVGIVNPAQLHIQSPSVGTSVLTAYTLETYGENSAIRLFAGSGDISLPALAYSSYAGTSTLLYPSSFEAVAFTGSISLSHNMILADSLTGGLKLLAGANINQGGFWVSTGASLVDGAFNAFAPNNGLDASVATPMLAHSGDGGVNLLYALTGNINGGVSDPNAGSSTSSNLFSSNRAIAVQAGGDILDFNLAAQNVNFSDVSSVIAGRDISYTGKYNYGGLQIAGPGSLQVEAGRDLGPFLPLAFDTKLLVTSAEGIQSIGNTGVSVVQGYIEPPLSVPVLFVHKPVLYRFPVGNWQEYSLTATPAAPPNPEFLGANRGVVAADGVTNGYSCAYLCFTGINNFLLPTTGASIVSMFGVAKGINYQGVISAYVDPASAANVPHNYLDELRQFLAGLGKTTADNADAWAQFEQLTPHQQQIFADQVFFAELKAPGVPDTPSYKQYQRGYAMVNLMFPADVSASGLYGYTRNGLGGGDNGANAMVSTGNLNLLHATIETQRGGDISVFGPGGSIFVGSVAKEPNTNLKLSNLGLLTLSGGSIDTFTDASVLVNASRVMTWFGGDILIWSSNGDIDAGRGARTTLSYPPLAVQFNQDDLESVDLGGSVSGAGIAVLKTKSFVNASDAILLAPRGTVDAGDAGIRVSGNLSILAVHVLNAFNIQVQGKTTGVPTVQAPNIAGLTAANNAAGAGAKTATPAAAKPADRPSVIIVEVIGYGGGDGTKTPPANGTDDGTDKKKRPADDRQGYDLNGNVRVLGYSTLGESEMIGLTEREKQAIRN